MRGTHIYWTSRGRYMYPWRYLCFPGTRPKYWALQASFLGSSIRYLSAASPAKLSSLAAEPLCAGLLPCLARSTPRRSDDSPSKPAQSPRSVVRQCLVEGSILAASTVPKATPPPAAIASTMATPAPLEDQARLLEDALVAVRQQTSLMRKCLDTPGKLMDALKCWYVPLLRRCDAPRL